jgi:hypothetical protein
MPYRDRTTRRSRPRSHVLLHNRSQKFNCDRAFLNSRRAIAHSPTSTSDRKQLTLRSHIFSNTISCACFCWRCVSIPCALTLITSNLNGFRAIFFFPDTLGVSVGRDVGKLDADGEVVEAIPPRVEVPCLPKRKRFIKTTPPAPSPPYPAS